MATPLAVMRVAPRARLADAWAQAALRRIERGDIPVIHMPPTPRPAFESVSNPVFIKSHHDLVMTSPVGSSALSNRWSGSTPEVFFSLDAMKTRVAQMPASRKQGISAKYIGHKASFTTWAEMQHYKVTQDSIDEQIRKYGWTNTRVKASLSSLPQDTFNGLFCAAGLVLTDFRPKRTWRMLDVEAFLERFRREPDTDFRLSLIDAGLTFDQYIEEPDKQACQIMAHAIEMLCDLDGCVSPSFRINPGWHGADDTQVVTFWGADGESLDDLLEPTSYKTITVGADDFPKFEAFPVSSDPVAAFERVMDRIKEENATL